MSDTTTVPTPVKRPALSDADTAKCISIAAGTVRDDRLRDPFTVPVSSAPADGKPAAVVGTLISADTVRVSKEWADPEGGVVRGGIAVAILPDAVSVAADTGWLALSDVPGLRAGYKLHIRRIALNSGDASGAYGEYTTHIKAAGFTMEPPAVSKRSGMNPADIKAAAAAAAVTAERARCIASLTAAGMKGPQLAATLKALGYNSTP